MNLRDVPIIPKGRCGKALDVTADYVTNLEKTGVLKFDKSPTGRKYASFRSLEAAADWLNEKTAA